jgi:hypothetical protein
MSNSDLEPDVASAAIDVCFWHKADIPKALKQCPLLGVKQTLIGHSGEMAPLGEHRKAPDARAALIWLKP